MIKLVVDTNILHQEGLSSGRMQLLKKLIDIEFVKLYIPELVKNEFITKKSHTTTDLLIKSANNLKSAINNFESTVDFKEELQHIEDSIRENVEKVNEKIASEYNDWEVNFRVTELLFKPEDIHEVMSDYFSGKGVYRSVKSRDDIPDAMINTCIEQLISEVGNVTVLVKDGVFKKHIQTNTSVTVFDGLSDFLKTEAVEALTNKAHAVEDVRKYFESNDARDLFTNHFKTLEDDIIQIYVEDHALINKDIICDRIYNAVVNFPIASNISNLKIENLYALNAQKFVGDISFETDATVHFIADYGIYLDIKNDKERNIEFDSMNSDGICDLLENYKVRYYGQVELMLADSFTKSVVEVLMRNIKNNEGAINISFDIESCELLFDGD